MIKMNESVKVALENINFLEQYQKISDKSREGYSFEDYGILSVDSDKVEKILSELHCNFSYSKKEKFYRVGDAPFNKENYTGLNISLKQNIIEIIWVVYRDGELLIGTPWNACGRMMVTPPMIIKPPLFKDYEELKVIFEAILKIVSDFKAQIEFD